MASLPWLVPVAVGPARPRPAPLPSHAAPPLSAGLTDGLLSAAAFDDNGEASASGGTASPARDCFGLGGFGQVFVTDEELVRTTAGCQATPRRPDHSADPQAWFRASRTVRLQEAARQKLTEEPAKPLDIFRQLVDRLQTFSTGAAPADPAADATTWQDLVLHVNFVRVARPACCRPHRPLVTRATCSRLKTMLPLGIRGGGGGGPQHSGTPPARAVDAACRGHRARRVLRGPLPPGDSVAAPRRAARQAYRHRGQLCDARAGQRGRVPSAPRRGSDRAVSAAWADSAADSPLHAHLPWTCSASQTPPALRATR